MRRLFLIMVLMIAVVKLYAQQTISRDTINLHGFIYDSEAKPVNFMYVQSTQNEVEHNTFKAAAFTNDRGYFEIKGAKLNDTLTLGPDVNYNLKPFYNRGSRMVVIYLPPAKVVSINDGVSLIVEGKRTSLRIKPTFKITPAENKPVKDAGREDAKYPGGMEALRDFLARNIQYPPSAIKANIEGEVEVTFTVNKDGTHRNFKVIRGLSEDCDNQVLQALRKSANWEPAYNNSQAVTMQESVTVMFILSGN